MIDATHPARWCHAVWVTHRRRAVFKLAGHSDFCERALAAAARRHGCALAAVVVRPDRVQALIRLPGGRRSGPLLRRLRAEFTARLRRAGIGRTWPLPIWGPTTWEIRVGAGTAHRLQQQMRRRGRPSVSTGAASEPR